MLSILKQNGKFKTPVKAIRTHGSEFLIYETEIGTIEKWEDIYQYRVCILNVKPTKRLIQDLQEMLERNTFYDYIIVDVLL